MKPSEKKIEVTFSFPQEKLREFCVKWKIKELAVFESAIRNDFDPDFSDIDLLVTFCEDTKWGLSDEVKMQAELKKILGREVDLVSRRAVGQSNNWIKRDIILKNIQPIYAV